MLGRGEEEKRRDRVQRGLKWEFLAMCASGISERRPIGGMAWASFTAKRFGRAMIMEYSFSNMFTNFDFASFYISRVTVCA